MKAFILTVISFLLVVLVLNAGYYKLWFQAKPLQYWTDFLKEKDDTSDAIGIMKARFGLPYTISIRIKEVLQQKKIAHPIILFEPNSYYRDSLHSPVRVPEPAVFYYYTGLEGVWTNSPNAMKANYIVRLNKKGLNLDIIKDSQQVRQLLAYYKKYIPIL